VINRILDFRFNIDQEFQGWILLFATLTAIWLFCLPCYCAGLSFAPFRRFAAWMQQRLPFFYLTMCCVNAVFMFLILTWLPDWTYLDYIKTVLSFAGWTASHLMQFATSIAMIAAFCIAVAFKDRIALMLGIDHKTLFKCKVRDCLNCWSTARFRPIEVSIWKVEDLTSADLFSANNVFVEFFLGYNEKVTTRVHNNAGSGCLVKETLQLNFDEDDDEETLFIFVRNQKVVGAQELARAEIPTEKLKHMVSQGRMTELRWDANCFKEPVQLIPRGKLWMRAVPLDDEDAPVTC